MQLRDRFPVDAVTGGDFVTRRYELRPGQRVVDLDTDLDALPQWGRLCLHEDTVRDMARLLGFEADPELAERAMRLAAEVEALRSENHTLLGALDAVENLSQLIRQRVPFEPEPESVP